MRAPYDTNTVTKIVPVTKGSYPHKKEQVAHYRFVTSKLETPVTVKCWMGRSASASVVYATVWYNNRDFSISGSGSGTAGGGGYHKESAAIADAFLSAGITMSRNFDGCGDTPVRVAIEALARKLGYRAGKVI